MPLSWTARPNWLYPLLRAASLSACLMVPACKSGMTMEAPTTATMPTLPPEEPRQIKTPEAIAQVLPAPSPTQEKNVAAKSESPAELTETTTTHPPRMVVAPANPTRVQTIGYQSKVNGLLMALEDYLEHRNDEAANILKRYPVEDQEFLLVVVPLLARIEQGETWSTLPPAQRLATVETLRGLLRRQTKSAPLVLQNVMLFDHHDPSEAPQFGVVKSRGNNLFRPGDLVRVYFEILNLVDSLGSDDLYSVRFSITIQVCNPDGSTAYGVTKESPRIGSITPRTDFYVPASFTLPMSVGPGLYQLKVFVTDMETGRQAKATLPLQIVERVARPNKKN